jgi:aromatic amino acid aminotransferase I
MLLERGDYLVMEEYAYSSAISCCGPMGIKIVGIEMDEQGMTATGLENVLSSWDELDRGGRKPRVVYLVPYIHVDATN